MSNGVVDGLWKKALNTLVGLLITAAFGALGVAINFYYEAKHDIATLKDQVHEILATQDSRIAANESKVRAIEPKVLRHGAQIASVVKKQDELSNTQMEFAKEVQNAPAAPAPQSEPIKPKG